MTGSFKLDLCAQTNSEEAIKRAIYRMADSISANLFWKDSKWSVQLFPKIDMPHAVLKDRFLTILADENLRVLIAPRINPIKDLIVSLAFGFLVKHND